MSHITEGHVTVDLEKENKILRYLLWIRHKTDRCTLYGDDGEMQCNSCHIDFKRDHPNIIEEKFMLANGLYTLDQLDTMKARANQKCINCRHFSTDNKNLTYSSCAHKIDIDRAFTNSCDKFLNIDKTVDKKPDPRQASKTKSTV